MGVCLLEGLAGVEVALRLQGHHGVNPMEGTTECGARAQREPEEGCRKAWHSCPGV